jgi:hypothetical protein
MLKRVLATFVITGVICLCGGAAEAQVFGVKGGVNLSTVSYDDFDISTPQKPAVVAGAFVRLRPARAIELQIEGLFTQRKWGVGGLEEVGTSITNTVTYVEMPVLLRYPLMTSGSARIRVHGGASFSYLLKADETVNGETFDSKDAYAPWDAALAAGAEIELKDRWVFDVRYLFGVTRLYHVEAEIPAKARSVQITAGYRFK